MGSKAIFILIVIVAFIGVIRFSGKTGTLSYKDLVRVDSLTANQEITSPITITGEARGGWYFEASFPIVVVDWDGKIIGEGYASAQGEWMTAEYVPFIANVEFDTGEISGNYSRKGTIILRKDNPSDLPEHDDAFEIPVVFK